MFNLRKVLLCFCLSFLFVVGVKADGLFDLKTEFIDYNDDKLSSISLFIETDKAYHVLYTKLDNAPSVITDDSLFDSSSYYLSEKNGIDSGGYKDYASLYGDVYVTLYSYDESSRQYQKVSNSSLIKRPVLSYGKRIDVAFYENDEDFMSLIVHDIYNRNSKLKIKVGEISDQSILNSYFNDKDYERVIEFAKDDNESIISFVHDLSKYDYEGDKNIKFTLGKYYYAYLEIDSLNGKYYPLNEIQILQAKNGSFGLVLGSDFEWEGVYNDESSYVDKDYQITPPVIISGTIGSGNDTSSTTENPKTGGNSVGILSIMVLFVGLLFVRKFNLFKKI